MSNQINQAKLDHFATAYEKNLAVCVEKYPQSYGFSASAVPIVAAKMKKAFADPNGYNKDGHAVKMTCKELNIPYTYKGINEYLHT